MFDVGKGANKIRKKYGLHKHINNYLQQQGRHQSLGLQ